MNTGRPQKIRRFIGWLGIVLVTVLGTTWILIHNNSVQQWTLHRVEQFAKLRGIQFGAQHIHFDPYLLQATLDGVVYSDNGVTLRATRLAIDLPWSVLTSSVKEITNLEVDNLDIKVNSPEPLVPEPSGKPTPLPKFRVDQLVVRNGSLDYRNQSMQFQIPSFALNVNHGQGSLRFDRKLSLPPDLVLDIPEIRLSLSDDGIQFAPAAWKLVYSEYNGAGVADGQLKWSPTLAAELSFSTEPLRVRQWTDIRASGKVKFNEGVLRISDFRAQQGNGEVLATAALSDKQHFVTATWKRLNLDPAGLPATSSGALTLQWKASDFSDASGSGSVALASQYGNAQSDIQIQNAKALLKLSANAPDASVTATVRTGLDQKIDGSFKASYKKYGDVTARGEIKGTLTSPLVQAAL